MRCGLFASSGHSPGGESFTVMCLTYQAPMIPSGQPANRPTGQPANRPTGQPAGRAGQRRAVGRIVEMAAQITQGVAGSGASSQHDTTQAAADYLMTIRYMLGEGQPVIAARLAERMGVSPATVSEMVNRLVREGLLTVDQANRHLDLTDAGRNAAERTFRKHALAEWLLTEVVGLGWAEADEEAHHLQHSLSDRVTDKLDELLGTPPTCPHGNPIPRGGTTPERPAGAPLSDAQPGTTVTILRVTEEAEEDGELLTFLQENGIRPGNSFRVTDVSAHVGTMTLDAEPDGRRVVIGLNAAAKIRMLEGSGESVTFHRVPARARLAASAAAG